MDNLGARLSEAVKQFWITREEQNKRQGSLSGKQDYGSRSAVTGGAQLNGFILLVREILIECNLPDATINVKRTTIPGYFRPTKDWDLVVVDNKNLIASIEFKSQVGSFGNNFNNRVEEALGSATDIWTAYREGVFKPSQRPWLGYLILLEDHIKSTTNVKIVKQPHFEILKEFSESSYMKRYELFCERLLRERLYDATCLLMSDKEGGLQGEYKEPSEELSFQNFATSLTSHVIAYAKKSGYA